LTFCKKKNHQQNEYLVGIKCDIWVPLDLACSHSRFSTEAKSGQDSVKILGSNHLEVYIDCTFIRRSTAGKKSPCHYNTKNFERSIREYNV
jgi:hypothetical protein